MRDGSQSKVAVPFPGGRISQWVKGQIAIHGGQPFQAVAVPLRRVRLESLASFFQLHALHRLPDAPDAPVVIKFR